MPSKPCAVCGRVITWRKKWARDWEQVRHCSDACRRNGLDPLDVALEAAVRGMAAARGKHATFCPSEAARQVAPDTWQALMERTRQAARRLHARGLVRIEQQGHPVDPSTARGPIRVRWTGPDADR